MRRERWTLRLSTIDRYDELILPGRMYLHGGQVLKHLRINRTGRFIGRRISSEGATRPALAQRHAANATIPWQVAADRLQLWQAIRKDDRYVGFPILSLPETAFLRGSDAERQSGGACEE